MCGIVGARHEWLLQQGLDPERAMLEAVARLRWRGPDGAAVVRAGGWWLGCARLAITQAHSRQPVVRRGRRFVGVLNGAVTNARELWAHLLPGAERRPVPPNDAWLPLLLVERGDQQSLRHLRGHHAYAVVDTSTDELVFGQDRFGEKPLFCLASRAGRARVLTAFASTPDALRALGMPALRPHRRAAELFRCGFTDLLPHRFTARLRLEGAGRRGEPLTTRASVAGMCRSWEPAPVTTPIAVRTLPEPADLRERFVVGVARCIDTAVPVGLFLSGGVDSSCIAAALRAARAAVPAYQFCATGSSTRERDVARAVAAHCSLPFHAVDGGPEVLDALQHLTQVVGLPLGDPSVLAVHALARAAAADGVRVALGGEGADELFLGYRRYRALAHMPRVPWPAAFTPQWSTSYRARWLRAVASDDPAQSLLAVTPPAFARVVLSADLAARRIRRVPAAAQARDRVEQARAADLDGYLRCDLLPKVDIATMAAGIEGRCPWLEGDYAEFGASRAALGKAPLRRAFANDLPAAVFRLPKHGFALPLDRWFRGNIPWLDLLADARTRQRPHLRAGGIATVLDQHRREHADLGHGLYLLVAYELFLRTLD